MEKILAILTEEEAYAKRLSAYTNLCGMTSLNAAAFGDAASLADFSEKHPLMVLLADAAQMEALRQLAEETGRFVGAERIIGLSESENREQAQREEALLAADAVVCKYQSADAILRSVMEACRDMKIRSALHELGTSRVIGVYSPVGRCGKTAFALTLSRFLSRKERVLYLNFEEFSGFSALTGTEYDVSLSDALYHLKQGSLNEQRIGSFIYHFSGIDYIPPIQFADDGQTGGTEGYAELISTILKQTEYETVVVDFASLAGEGIGLMELCSALYVPFLDDANSRRKIDELETYLTKAGKESVRKKLCRVCVPEQAATPFGDGYVDALLFGAVGDFVRELYGCGAA